MILRSSPGAMLREQRYAHDASSKLTSHTVNGVVTSYTYDGNGNRLTRTVNGVTETYAYDDGDKLLTVSVGGIPVKTYGYDAAGRTTSVVAPGGTTTIAYDFEGRATSIVGPGVSQTNVYNGLDTRVGSTTSSVTRTFLRDGAYVTDPVLKDGAATYTPGISERRGTDTTYLHSGLKNADAQSSPAQALTGTRQYDAFGNLATSTLVGGGVAVSGGIGAGAGQGTNVAGTNLTGGLAGAIGVGAGYSGQLVGSIPVADPGTFPGLGLNGAAGKMGPTAGAFAGMSVGVEKVMPFAKLPAQLNDGIWALPKGGRYFACKLLEWAADEWRQEEWSPSW